MLSSAKTYHINRFINFALGDHSSEKDFHACFLLSKSNEKSGSGVSPKKSNFKTGQSVESKKF